MLQWFQGYKNMNFNPMSWTLLDDVYNLFKGNNETGVSANVMWNDDITPRETTMNITQYNTVEGAMNADEIIDYITQATEEALRNSSTSSTS
jgi:hypothetical protein